MKHNLRPRTCRSLDEETKYAKNKIAKQVREISQLNLELLSADDARILRENEQLVLKVTRNRRKQELHKIRLKEVEDDPHIVLERCKTLSGILSASNHVIVYTGAGISTSAKIPDFRGPDGIWTRLNNGKNVLLNQSLTSAEPTATHMCLKALYDEGIVKHIVSQNCDGLHLRSGIPQHALSEIHGNMYIEICKDCEKQIYRIFDVTEKTSLHRHKTGRICQHCGNYLKDTIVHFGERSNLRWPHNWEGAVENVEKADVILCLGSSLKVMRSYKQLWMMSKPKHKRPALYIVNLQWTPKDSQATLKIHSRVDFVMEAVTKQLGISIPDYLKEEEPMFSLATQHDFNGPTIPIPQAFKSKFNVQVTEKDSPCCSTQVISNKPHRLMNPDIFDQKNSKDELRIKSLPQDKKDCTATYANNEFYTLEMSFSGNDAHDVHGKDTHVNTCNASLDRNDMQEGADNTSTVCYDMDKPEVKSQDLGSPMRCLKTEEHQCVELGPSVPPTIGKFFNINCATSDKFPTFEDPLNEGMEFSEYRIRPVKDVTDTTKVPSWFGKGLKTKIAVSKRRKRRRK